MNKRVEIISIQGERFLAFKSPFTHPIRPFRNLVAGMNLTDATSESNGSGKSSLLDAICWVIFKKTTKEKDPSFNFEGNCWVTLTANINKKTYEVTRYYKHSVHGTSVRVLEDGIDVSMRKKVS